MQSQITNLPFGDGYTSTGGQGDDRDFAGLNRDQEFNSEQAQYREYSPTQGHWLTPDPYAGSYDAGNPQSFNRYAYALNNPVSLNDPTGFTPVCTIDPVTGILECTSSYPGDGGDDGGNNGGGGGNQPPPCYNPGTASPCVAPGGSAPSPPSVPGSPPQAPSKPGVGTCVAQAASNGRAIALAADLVGDIATGVALTNPASTAAILIGTAATSVGTLNAIAQNGGFSDLGVAGANQTISATGVLTHGLEIGTFIQAGTSFAKGLTYAGVFGSVVSTVTDAGAAISAYHKLQESEVMISVLARFEQLSTLTQSMVFVALTAPLFAAFAIAGDLPRGTLVWTFSGALLIALNAHKEKTSLRKLGLPAAVLLAFHLPLVIWDPLKHAPFFGGIVTPIVLADYCTDYAFLWSWLKVQNG